MGVKGIDSQVIPAVIESMGVSGTLGLPPDNS